MWRDLISWFLEVLFAFLLLLLEGTIHFLWNVLPLKVVQSYIISVLHWSGKSKIVDPRYDMNFVELVNSYGYFAEEHFAKTEDGYVLGIHRVKARGIKKFNGAVFIQHGMMQTSETFVCRAPNKALAFILADAGYDVWLGNNRGNKYSYKHIQHSPNNEAFWNFCIDDFALRDLPAMLEYVLVAANVSKLFYIGFSQGSAQAFASFSVNPRLADKIELFIALAPATVSAKLNNKMVAALTTSRPDLIYRLFGRKALLHQTTFWRNTLATQLFVPLIDNSMKFLFGWDTSQIDPKEKPVLYSHIFSYSSVKTLVHWFQITSSRRFQMYDGYHRPVQDKSSYASYVLPCYKPSTIRCPIALFYGGRDTITDMGSMLASVPPNTYVHKEESYEHIDLIWAENVHERIFSKVLELISSKLAAVSESQKILAEKKAIMLQEEVI